MVDAMDGAGDIADGRRRAWARLAAIALLASLVAGGVISVIVAARHRRLWTAVRGAAVTGLTLARAATPDRRR
jgi:hypothetical protein